MPRKRYTDPERRLAAIISGIAQSGNALRDAIDLLRSGPLRLDDVDLPLEEYGMVAGQIEAFTASLVRRLPTPTLGTYRPVNFTGAVTADGRIAIGANGDASDLLVLQYVLLVHEVGLGQVRACAAPDCRRLFVRSYRQEFCSGRCQKRINTRVQRQQAREARERRARQRKRARSTVTPLSRSRQKTS